MTTPRSRLRVIRANTQALQRSVAHLGGTDAEFNARFPSELVLWDENAGDIETDFQTLRAELEQGAAKADIEDDVEAVRNAWSEAREGFKAFRANPGDQAARTAALGEIDERLHAMVLGLAKLTIPQRVAEYLAQERSGGAFHFHTAFADELPLEADRVAVLKYLQESPGGLYGLVDVEAGVIWAFARSPWRRLRAYAGAIVILVVGGVLAWFSHDIAAGLKIDAPFAPRESMLAAYILVLVGVIGHILLDVYKRARSTDTDSPAVLDELLLWGSIHEVQLLTTALGVWVGTLILAALENPISAWSAFVTGYSLDSILDAGIQRLDSTVSKAATDLTGKFGAGSGGT